MAVELFADSASTTLTNSPGIAGTSFTVASSTGFPAASNVAVPPTQFRVLIGTEMVTVTNVAALTWTCLPLTAAHTSADPVTHVVFAESLGGLQYPMNSGRPASLDFETFPRALASGAAVAMANQTVYMTAIRLPKGYPIRKIGFYATVGDSGAPISSYYTVHDENRVLLAETADQGSASWGIGLRILPVAFTAAGAATEFKTTYAGIHYLGAGIKDITGRPSLAAVTGQTGLNTVPPILSGVSTAPTNYPVFPFTGTAITPTAATIWAGVSS